MIFVCGSRELDEKAGIKSGRLSGIVNHHVPAYLRSNQKPSYATNITEDWEEKLDKILANEALEYDESRFVLNAKQQILWMETVAAALIAGRREDFDAAIQKIKNQAHV